MTKSLVSTLWSFPCRLIGSDPAFYAWWGQAFLPDSVLPRLTSRLAWHAWITWTDREAGRVAAKNPCGTRRMRGSTGVLMGHQRSSLPRLELGMRSERDSAGQRPQLLGPSAGVGLTAGVGGVARPALGLGSTVLGLTAGGAVSPGAGGAGAGAGAVLGATAAGAGAKSTGSVAAGAGGGGVTPGGRLPGGISVTGAAVPIGVPLLGAPITVPLIGAPTTGAPTTGPLTTAPATGLPGISRSIAPSRTIARIVPRLSASRMGSTPGSSRVDMRVSTPETASSWYFGSGK